MKALLLILLCALPVAAQEVSTATASHAWSVGVNYLGGQVDYDYGRGHRLEARVLTGKEDSNEGKITSTVVGFRSTQRFRLQSVYHPYVGVEAAYVQAKVTGGQYSVEGFSPGLFIGVERPLSRRLTIGLDIGPYLFILTERNTHARTATFDSIINAYLLYRIF